MSKLFSNLEMEDMKLKKDPLLKKRIFATRSAAVPMNFFCEIACDVGHPIIIGELFAMGQEYSDNQCKSTNGGNPNPYDSFEDTYEIFLNSL